MSGTVIDRIREPSNGIFVTAFHEGESRDGIVDELPAAIYVTAAAALWGHRPTLGDSIFCSSVRLCFSPRRRYLN